MLGGLVLWSERIIPIVPAIEPHMGLVGGPSSATHFSLMT